MTTDPEYYNLYFFQSVRKHEINMNDLDQIAALAISAQAFHNIPHQKNLTPLHGTQTVN